MGTLPVEVEEKPQASYFFPTEHSATLTAERLGRMKCPDPNTMTGTRTFSGLQPSDVLSRLRLRIRMGNTEYLGALVTELYLLKYLGCKAVTDALYETLALVAVTNVSVANLTVAALVVRECNRFRSTRGQGPTLSQVQFLATQLCLAPKTHLVEWLWNAYTSNMGMSAAIKQGRHVETRIETATLIGVDQELAKKANSYFREQDDAQLVRFGVAYYTYLASRHPSALLWLKGYIERSKIRGVRIVREGSAKTRPEYVVFEMLRGYISPPVVNAFEASWLRGATVTPYLQTLTVAALLGHPPVEMSEINYPAEVVDDLEKVYTSQISQRPLRLPEEVTIPAGSSITWPEYPPIMPELEDELKRVTLATTDLK